MSFSKSVKKAQAKISDPKSNYNQMFLIGELFKDEYHPADSDDGRSTNRVKFHKGEEVIICKVEAATTMGELVFDPDKYKSVRVVAGVLAASTDNTNQPWSKH